MLLPRSLNGAELDPSIYLQVIEVVAAIHQFAFVALYAYTVGVSNASVV